MSAASTPHLWQGAWLSDDEMRKRIANLPAEIETALKTVFDVRALLDACEKLSGLLRDADSEVYRALEKMLEAGFHMQEEERTKELGELAKFLTRADLEDKLACELGAGDPFNFARRDYRTGNFERWSPLGFLVHIAPTNAYSAGAWTVLEGLLSGNVNFLKTGGSDQIFAQQFLRFLIDQDTTGTLAPRIFACRISSKEQELLSEVLSNADGVVVWGDEGAIKGIKELSPATARFIEWGPKISFAFFAEDSLDDREALEGLAREVCRMEQQACSSPQCVYVETDDRGTLLDFAERLAGLLDSISPTIPVKEPGPQEQAEITSVVELCRQESCLDLTRVIEASDLSWRVLVDFSSVLKASPLFRTIWVKPLLRDRLPLTLRPFRSFLQTAGLASSVASTAELCETLDRSGVLRITRVGRMLDSYSGEPHDGVYALQRYSRRVSVQMAGKLRGIANFADLKPVAKAAPEASIMTKEMFQASVVSPEFSELFFKSGGSSGEPKMSIFTYDDYHLQMRAAADGLFAAGLDPRTDRCMNLFFAGGLYGGFVSFFTILEMLKAVQFPMGGYENTQLVAENIVNKRCNVLLGMPSYIMRLFSENKELLRQNQVVEKIFYGGEHFNESQRRYFQSEFGIKLIRSGGYGSVDAGPIGYQCQHCTGSIHHMHTRLHVFEILDPVKDEPVVSGNPGRVVLSSMARHGQRLERYEIGDIAREVSETCPCGRLGPRFELLGRHGDIFKIGSAFFNYGKIAQIFAEQFDYAGELQIVLRPSSNGRPEQLDILVTPVAHGDPDRLCSELLDSYFDLKEMVQIDKLLDLKVSIVSRDQLARTASSGKLRHIVDERVPV